MRDSVVPRHFLLVDLNAGRLHNCVRGMCFKNISIKLVFLSYSA